MSTSSHVCVYKEERAVTIKEFFHLYKDKLPMLAVIVDGLYGYTRYDTFDNYQVMRIHAYSTQPRVVAVPAKADIDRGYFYYTIPLNYWTKFRVVRSHNNVESPRQLDDIIKDNKLPLLVNFACDPRLKLKVGHSTQDVETIGNLLLTRVYDHHYFLVNCIYGDDMEMIPGHTKLALSDEITATPVTGLVGKTQEEFQTFLKSLDDIIATSGDVFDMSWGHPEIDKHVLDRQAMFEGSGGITESDEPLISFADLYPASQGPPPQLPQRQRAKPDDEDEAAGVYTVIDPSYFYSEGAPAIPERSPISPVIPEREAEEKITKKTIKKGIKGFLFGSKASHKGSDKKGQQSGPVVHDYLNTKIGRAEVKPMVQLSSTSSVSKDSISTRPEQPLPETRSDSDDDYYEQCSDLRQEVPVAKVSPEKQMSKSSEFLHETVDVESLTIEGLATYLKALKLEHYREAFKDNMVDGMILTQLDKSDLMKQFGLSVIEAVRLTSFAKDGHVPK